MPDLSVLPVDYSIFEGLAEVADEKSREINIVFMDEKKGK
jgi:hypothetical protein